MNRGQCRYFPEFTFAFDGVADMALLAAGSPVAKDPKPTCDRFDCTHAYAPG